MKTFILIYLKAYKFDIDNFIIYIQFYIIKLPLIIDVKTVSVLALGE